MRATSATDYALRALICLDGKEGRMSLTELSEKTGVGSTSIRRTLRKLRDAGWVRSAGGNDGGYRLCVDIKQITVLDVMRAMDDSITFIYPVPQGGEYLERFVRTRKMYSRHQALSERYFSGITVKSLLP